ncbi:heavy metal sensor histidine kinase [Acerihabitans arboris]|uniref:Sensor protein n=1 Tax=Acerihabitans arboris TaxID=2691583 RepID=A0A845SLC5_9GAMM|nr:heavy metal sensor histidine kinase [Acerihabitans arboris]NDL63774.1 heavy metal sensor histidine kinase [Acerihabitans arboris]
MKSLSLTSRLSLILAALVMLVMATVGYALYRTLEEQLIIRDDGALITRVEQIRTLLLNEDVMTLIREKPGLFANMLGNTESLLVLRIPGRAPLIEVNPGHSPIPQINAVAADAPLSLASVHHAITAGGIPFISASALATISVAPYEVTITTGRLMTERTRTLAMYRHQIILVASGATVLTALLAWFFTRRGLKPLRRLADETASIDIRLLSRRIGLKRAPPELRQLIDAFNTMLDRLETSFRQLSQVSADMAHDLRTPIGILLGQTEVAMRHKRGNDYYENLLGSNFEELLRLSKMIDNMLFLARAEDAGHAIQRAQLSVAVEFQRLADYFEGPAEERGLTLVCDHDGGVWADAELLRRALANLLANAVRYADPGTTIVLQAEQQPEGTLIGVENSGPTIAPEQLERVFDRFYRADASRIGASNATGLGLSIVRSIMVLHQGRWDATSGNHRTRFSLFFPAKRPGGP